MTATRLDCGVLVYQIWPRKPTPSTPFVMCRSVNKSPQNVCTPVSPVEDRRSWVVGRRSWVGGCGWATTRKVLLPAFVRPSSRTNNDTHMAPPTSSPPLTETQTWATDRAVSLVEVWALVAAFNGLVGAWRLLGVCRAARAGAKEFLRTLPRLADVWRAGE